MHFGEKQPITELKIRLITLTDSELTLVQSFVSNRNNKAFEFVPLTSFFIALVAEAHGYCSIQGHLLLSEQTEKQFL